MDGKSFFARYRALFARRFDLRDMPPVLVEPRPGDERLTPAEADAVRATLREVDAIQAARREFASPARFGESDAVRREAFERRLREGVPSGFVMSKAGERFPSAPDISPAVMARVLAQASAEAQADMARRDREDALRYATLAPGGVGGWGATTMTVDEAGGIDWNAGAVAGAVARTYSNGPIAQPLTLADIERAAASLGPSFAARRRTESRDRADWLCANHRRRWVDGVGYVVMGYRACPGCGARIYRAVCGGCTVTGALANVSARAACPERLPLP